MPSPSGMARIDCHQLAPVIGDRAANQAMILAAVQLSVTAGADVIVLPELALTGYAFDSAAEARSVAISADDPLLAQWSSAAGDSIIIAGFVELGDDGGLYNSAAILDRTGVLSVYRKLHLWDREKLIFTAGSQPPPVLDTAVGRVAVLICYDLEFAELTRPLALAGVDLIAVPTNWPLMRRPAGERPAEVLNAMVAARANHVVIACCDRTGTERGQQWTAGTAILDVDGWPIGGSDSSASANLGCPADMGTPADTGLITATVALARSRDKRLTDLCDALGDRRPEVYAGLAAAYSGLPVRP